MNAKSPRHAAKTPPLTINGLSSETHCFACMGGLRRNVIAKIRTRVGINQIPSSRVNQNAERESPKPIGQTMNGRALSEILRARPIANATLNNTREGYRADR